MTAHRGSYELAKLRQKAFEADVKLREAAVKGEDLPEAEKKDCIKDSLKAQAATQEKNLETENMHCEKYEKLMNLTYTNSVPNMPKKNPEEQIKNLPKGKVYMATGLNMSLMMKGVVGSRPGNLMLLSKESARQNLDKVAEQIMDEDQMLNMQPRDLVKKLSFDIGSETKIDHRAMEIRMEKGYDKQPLAEIRAEAGIEEPKKKAPTNVVEKNAEVVKSGEEPKKNIQKVNIMQ